MSTVVRRILVVDDNPAIHQDFQKILAPGAENERHFNAAEAGLFGVVPARKSSPGFHLDFVSEGTAALALVQAARNEGHPYCVIFMDVRMPTAPDGIQTTAQIFTQDPDIQVVLCSAYADYNLEEISRQLPQSDRFVILKKPFEIVEVRQLANAFAEKWRLSREARENLRLLEQTVHQRTAELHWKTALLEAQLNSTIDGVLLVDPRGKIILSNQAFFRIFHVPNDLVEENNDAKLLHQATSQVKDPGAFLARVKELYAHPEEIGRDEVELGDGTVLDRYSAPVQDRSGNHYGRIWIFRDITERKHTEVALQGKLALRERLAKIAASVPGIIYAFRLRPDGTACLPYVSPTIEDFYGVAPEGLEQDATPVFALVHPDDQARLQASIAESARTLLPWYAEFRIRHPRKGEIWVEGQSTPEAQGDGSVLWHGFMSHVTARKQAETELRLRTTALEAAASGVAITDRAGKIVWINPAFTQLTGYPAAEVLGRTLALLKSGRHDRQFYQGMWETILAGNIWRGEIINRRKDGVCYHEEMTITPVCDPDGQVVNFVAMKQDVSQRKEAEELLARERDLLQALLDNVPDYVYFKDLQSRYTRINTALARYFGLPSPEAATGRGDMDFFTLRFERQCFVDEQRIMATGEPIVDRIEEWRSATGKANWVSTTKVPLRGRNGHVSGLIGISRDFTPRRLAEERLARTNECILSFGTDIRENIHRLTRLACGLLNARSAVYWHVDGEQLMALTSHGVNATEALTARPAPLALLHELAGKSRDRLQLISPLSGSTCGAQLAEYGLAGFKCAVTVPIRNGEELMGGLILLFPYEIERAILNDQVLTAVAAAVQVEEERWRATRERQQIEIQLRNAQKLEAIGQLAAGIAHEINTPTQYVGDNTRFFKDSFDSLVPLLRHHEQLLEAVKTNTLTPELVARAEQALAAGDLPYLFEQIPTAIRETLEGIERVTKIVRAMKEFSHPGNREKSLADLNKAIESTVTVARNEWKYVADLELDLDPALPLVPCFLGEFNQAVLNLVINAAHAIADVVRQTPGTKGKITVRTRGEGEAVEIRITDTGTGIPEAIRPRIFEPFFTTKAVGKGTGQGLSIVYATIVKKHGGLVSFETEVGQGATFILRLPVRSPVAEPVPA